MWKPRVIPLAIGLLAVCALGEVTRPPQIPVPDQGREVAYVCACLRKSSCPCMTEARQEGPCACGTKGGPPLKEVLANSAWARYNRKALAGSSSGGSQ
ncbi:MAG: hypothetical protein ACRD1C_10240 [Terriglobales bacterium]